MNTRSPKTAGQRRLPTAAVAAACLALLAACGSTPTRNATLDQARSRLDTAQAQPHIAALAASELAKARESLRRADQARINDEGETKVSHLSYLALQEVVIAEDSAAGRRDQAVTANAGAERDRMRLAMRTQEADQAQAQKLVAEQAAAAKTLQMTQQLAVSDAATQAERDRVARRDRTVGDLEAQLRELKAQYTDRGAVVTLGDLLFETGASDLRTDGQHSMQPLAAFLKRYPQQHATIEGHTDNVGSESSNQALSARRAQSVMAALLAMGVSASQLNAQSFGEASPIATNATAAGRQTNRRVEVVFARDAQVGLTGK